MAHNDKYVAVWDRGGLDMSQGAGNPCGGSAFAQYASYRPGGTGYFEKFSRQPIA